MDNNYVKYISNPKVFTLKKWLSDILKEDYMKHDNITERVGSSLTTDSDLHEFGGLITAIYDKAYRKAINDYKEQAEKMGVKVNINYSK